MAYRAASGHIPCAFSIVEILAVLYRNHLRFPNGDVTSSSRDYMVLSKGHGVMTQYVCLHQNGWLDDADLDNYFKCRYGVVGLDGRGTRPVAELPS
jgi:transketolase